MKNTTVGVYLAKDVIQAHVYANKKVRSDNEMTHHDFHEWLFKTHRTTHCCPVNSEIGMA